MKRSLMLMAVSTIVLGMLGCDALRDYPKKIQEFPEPWKTLEAGVVGYALKTEMLTEGNGQTISTGDLVQIGIRYWSTTEQQFVDNGHTAWIWIGFLTEKETSFYGYAGELSGALVGKTLGGSLKLLEGAETERYRDGRKVVERDKSIRLYANPFGDPHYYGWKKNLQGFEELSAPFPSGSFNVMDIKRVCKGQSKYRTVRLFDDSPVQVCSGLNCRVTTEAREAWIDEARIDAVCNDGKKVSFQYGPIGSRNGKEGRSPKRGYFDEWLLKAWDKIPRGVRFEGNHAPVIETTPVKTKTGVALAIDFRKFAHDADGDSLTARIIRAPENGKLIPNPDGSVTYTPNDKYHGIEHVNFGISDGMTETSGMIDIEVTQPAR